ncbi:hypothetical protein INT43_003606 [Umbelopsis isabellina]|uniref:Uncharacterized protein n=1 Tax=Mortierella isabellina TaxID=91625 RepID=A0A8H7PTC2_MORIS|nr:hypothetical protein INT43_003606 [Umbelopsis isabellina]
MRILLLALLSTQLFVGLVQSRPLYSLALLSLGSLEQEPVLLPDFASSIFNANRQKVIALEKSIEESEKLSDTSSPSLSITDVNDSTALSRSDATSDTTSDNDISTTTLEPEPTMAQAESDFEVDLSRFSQLLSVHLLFDHFENAVTNLAEKVSRRFQETIQFSILNGNGDSDIIPEDDAKNEMVFDIQVLKGQIRGAVGSFIEDNLPNVWYQHATSLDKASLQQKLRQITMSLCEDSTSHPDTVAYSCIVEHSTQLQSQMDRFVGKNLDRTLAFVTKRELPRLFEATASEVHSVLLYFNRHVLHSSDKRLQIQLARQAEDTEEEWIRKEVSQVFEAAAHWEHAADEDENANSVAKFAQLAKV